MNTQTINLERDEVLFAFHQECQNPTAEQIISWINRYPQFADDIRDHAAIIKDWAARESLPAAELSAAMISRSQSRAMDALHKARTAAAAQAATAPALTFELVMAQTNTNVPALARTLDIDRTVLSALINGRMLAPVGHRLRNALSDLWSVSVEQFDRAVQWALGTPRLSQAKSDGAPEVVPRTYAEVIQASGMSEVRKRFWLGED